MVRALPFVALVLGACSERDQSVGGVYGGPVANCAVYTSCGTCTPVPGCGWCYNADGTGTCAPDPDGCTTPSFSWTWEPNGCRVGAEAGVVSYDAASKSSAEAGGE
jgi:hypothetical protein